MGSASKQKEPPTSQPFSDFSAKSLGASNVVNEETYVERKRAMAMVETLIGVKVL